jgi:hypothetical protein
LQKREEDADIQTNGTIFYKSVQQLAYAEDRHHSKNPTLTYGSVPHTRRCSKKNEIKKKPGKNKIYDYKSECKAKRKYNYK